MGGVCRIVCLDVRQQDYASSKTIFIKLCRIIWTTARERKYSIWQPVYFLLTIYCILLICINIRQVAPEYYISATCTKRNTQQQFSDECWAWRRYALY